MWYTSTEEIGCTHVVEFRYFPRGIADDWVKQTVKPMWLHLQTAHRTYTLYHTPLTASECCRTIRHDQQYEYAHAWPLVWANCQHRREANKTRISFGSSFAKTRGTESSTDQLPEAGWYAAYTQWCTSRSKYIVPNFRVGVVQACSNRHTPLNKYKYNYNEHAGGENNTIEFTTPAAHNHSVL